MSTDQDTRTRPPAPVAPLPQPATPTPPLPSASGSGQVDALAPREVLALYSGQADELAAMVESALAEEDARYEDMRRLLADQHRRRRAVLATLAGALAQQCGDLDEAAATVTSAAVTRAAGAPATVCGFAAGDRVRDPRSGCTGRVRIHALTAAERAAGGVDAEVVWDGFDTVVALEFALAHGLERLG